MSDSSTAPMDASQVKPPKVVTHFTRAERAARGKAARAEVPRSTQGEIDFPPHRDPIALLEEQAVSRVPELVPIRYGRMLVSPFAFYRGGALIMAADLARRRARVFACSCAATRTCRTSGCSARPSGSWSSTSTTSTRRRRARGSGT